MNVGAIESNYPVRFGKLTYALPDFKSINEAAYWDYQQNRVYFRSKRKPMGQRGPGQLKKPPPNVDKIIRADEPRPPACPKSGSKQFYKNGIHSRTIYDLRFSRAGVRRWVIRYYYQRYQCRDCTHGQNELSRFEKCGKSLQAFVVYQLVELRMSHSAIVRSIATLFRLNMSRDSVNRVKTSSPKRYLAAYNNILDQIAKGELVHADETQIKVRSEVHYVWVFANLTEVAYVYSRSRDGSTAQDVLRDFKGVLVSDFYSGYDGIKCVQQKCLIHLNDDVLRHPFNEEMKEIAGRFAGLLKPVIDTIDRYGLKAYHLRKHKKSVEQFYSYFTKHEYNTEVAAGYKKRFEKNRDKLFVFLDYDGVPWNNNNAEHAVKAFANLRITIGASGTAKGISEYLVLLSISETCKLKGVDFLTFLQSDKVDI